MLRGKLARVALVKVPDVAFNPIHIRLLGAYRIVLDPDAGTDLVEQARSQRRCGGQ